MSFSEDSPHPESPMRKLLRIGRAATEERCRSIRRLPVERTDSRALLIVVRVDRLEARLAEAPPNQVLHELADATDRSPLLEEVDANQFRCALVSYRQERSAGAAPTPADPTPESTIDAEALVGVVEAAKQLGAEGLWLDAWCYRSRGAYDHDDFCRTLRHVVATVHGVVWLPRSKRASAGHYAYRMWCTFEAVVVQQRGLPVQVAGLGVSATQRHVRRFGKYSFWLWGGDGVLDQLARMNAAFYTLILCHVVHLAVRAWRLSFDSAINDVENFLMSAAVAFTSYPIVWRFCLSMLPEARLATNARRVLRIMAYQTVVASPQGLLRDMALLRAYDRRDALVVASLLQMICPELALGGHAMRALAFCCYAASRLEGRPACGSVSAWLEERGIHLREDGGLGERRGGQREGSRGSAREGGRKSSWPAADGRDAVVQLGLAENFGLKAMLGVSCGLRCALGVVWTRPPTRHVWTLDGAVWSCGRAMQGDVAALFFLVSAAAYVSRAIWYPLDACYARPRCLTSLSLSLANCYFLAYAFRLDWPTWRLRLVPPPPFLPDKPRAIAVITVITIALTAGELAVAVGNGVPLAFLTNTSNCEAEESFNDYIVATCLTYFSVLNLAANFGWLYRSPASFLKGSAGSENILCIEPPASRQLVGAMRSV